MVRPRALAISGLLRLCTTKCDFMFLRAIIDQTFPKILADKIPFYQYDDRQILPALLVRKEIPLRPDPDVVTADWEGISDQLWDLLVMCWNYEPEARPSCTMLQGFIGTFGNQDNQSEGVTEIESCSTFRRGCSVNIDFVHVERLLNQVRDNVPKSCQEGSLYVAAEQLTNRFHCRPVLLLSHQAHQQNNREFQTRQRT